MHMESRSEPETHEMLTDGDSQASNPAVGVFGFTIDPRFTDVILIDQGGNGVVVSAIDSDCDKKVAIKKLCFGNTQSTKYALRELKLLRQLRHENVVSVYEILGPDGHTLDLKHPVPVTSAFNCVYLVQECMDASLRPLLQACQLSSEHVRLFLYQILRGLKYIHSANVLHRDLKPSNLLINLDDLMVKIGDFGLARVLDPAYSHKGYLTDRVGTCWYRAPELILTPRDYSLAVDIWAVGCIFVEMLTGQPVFVGAHEMEQIGHVLDTIPLNDNEWNRVTQVLPDTIMRKHLRFPKETLKIRYRHLDADAVDLLEKMLSFSPCMRITAELALGHPYLQQYACLTDEPVVSQPFHIEHEVDDLPAYMLRQLIIEETSRPGSGCGNQAPIPGDTLTNPTITGGRPKNKTTKVHLGDTTGQIAPAPWLITDLPSEHISNEARLADNSQAAQAVGVTNASISSRGTTSTLRDICASKSKSLKEILFIDLSDVENAKEFCQLSPKEKADHINCKQKLDQRGVINGGRVPMTAKMKDQLNEEKRTKSPMDKPGASRGASRLVEIGSSRESRVGQTIVPTIMTMEQITPPRASGVGQIITPTGATRTVQNITPAGATRTDQVSPTSEIMRRLPEGTGMADILSDLQLGQHNNQLFIPSRETSRRGRKPNKHKSMAKDPWCKKELGNNNNKPKRGNKQQKSPSTGDFDSLYRLPTEHLSRNRRRTEDSLTLARKHLQDYKIEKQVKLREEWNERLRLSEMDRDSFPGAVGGSVDLSPSIISMDPILADTLHICHPPTGNERQQQKSSNRRLTRENHIGHLKRDSSSSSDDQRYEG